MESGLASRGTARFIRVLSRVNRRDPVRRTSFAFKVRKISHTLLTRVAHREVTSFSIGDRHCMERNTFRCMAPPRVRGVPGTGTVCSRVVTRSRHQCSTLTRILGRGRVGAFLDRKGSRGATRHLTRGGTVRSTHFILPGTYRARVVVAVGTHSLVGFFHRHYYGHTR